MSSAAVQGRTGSSGPRFDIGNSTIIGRAADLITDFNRVEGDQIDLHPIDADATTPGNQDFSTILIPEGAAFTTPGQIKLAAR